jgi:hypothetical protein
MLSEWDYMELDKDVSETPVTNDVIKMKVLEGIFFFIHIFL